jgi:hypothetical protein
LLLADWPSAVPTDLESEFYHVDATFNIVVASRMSCLVTSVTRVMKIFLKS